MSFQMKTCNSTTINDDGLSMSAAEEKKTVANLKVKCHLIESKQLGLSLDFPLVSSTTTSKEFSRPTDERPFSGA